MATKTTAARTTMIAIRMTTSTKEIVPWIAG